MVTRGWNIILSFFWYKSPLLPNHVVLVVCTYILSKYHLSVILLQHLQKQKWMSIDIYIFFLTCHFNVRGVVVRVISICKVSIDVWFFSSTSHTTCQNLNCACQLTCNLFLYKFLRVNYQKLVKTLSKIHTDEEQRKTMNTLHTVGGERERQCRCV